MIKLFRNLRKQLLNEGKTSKYLTYAVGEIVLVVIGILIALSINTWNENRKIRQSEQDILNNLKSELITNKAKLDNVYQRHITEANNGIRMLRLFNTDVSEIPIDTLEKLFLSVETSWTFEPNNGFIKSLIASGKIDHIENVEIKAFITSFEGLVIDAIQEGESFRKLVDERLWPAIDGKLNSANRARLYELYADIPQGSYTSDYTWFFSNREMEDIISNLTAWKKDIISDEQKLMASIDQIIVVIDTALKNK